MEWVAQHLTEIFGVVGASLLVYLAPKMWRLAKYLWVQNLGRLLKELRAARRECSDLRRELIAHVRDGKISDDIHRQDRATIAALKGICDEHECVCHLHNPPSIVRHGVDYTKIAEEVRRAISGEHER